MKKFLIVLSIVFVCGIITADIFTGRLLNTEIILSMDMLKKYAYSELFFNDVIWNLMYERLKQYICILLCGITPLKNYISIILVGILLFCFGFFTMSCILAIGFVGVLIGIASIIPHGFLYYVSYHLMSQQSRVYSYQQTGKIPQKIITYILAIMFFITGCVIECVIGVHFIPWLIRVSLI